MTFIILGLLVWIGAHGFKRLAPGVRERMGDPAKGLVAGGVAISIVLMVLGYRSVDHTPLWQGPGWLVGVNNLMVLLAFYFFAASGAKTWVATKIRHPQLTGFGLWAAAHLLVNESLAAIVLFGGFLVWAIVIARVISAAEGPWMPPEQAPPAAEARAIIVTLVLVAVVGYIHGWVGPWPFGGGA